VSTRRVKGTTPPVFVRDGKPVPPSPDVAEHNLAQLIGQSTAYHLAQLLEPVLAAIAPRRHMCIVCTAKLKAEAAAYEVALANAVAAAEPQPAEPDTRVAESFTDGARGPVCWACFDQKLDGPYDLAEYLPPPVD
jgi:hypothetical protein